MERLQDGFTSGGHFEFDHPARKHCLLAALHIFSGFACSMSERKALSEKQDHAADDAREIWGILRTARCMGRYDKISHEVLAELLVSIATGGEVVGGNNRGSDVRSPRYGLVEVKSRILGTDGPYPRVSLKRHNLEKADWFAAVRWRRDYTLHDAVMLPKLSARALYEKKKQATGLAHIGWSDWASAPDGLNIRQQCADVMDKLR